jgi:hypothetical protein
MYIIKINLIKFIYQILISSQDYIIQKSTFNDLPSTYILIRKLLTTLKKEKIHGSVHYIRHQ